MRTLATAAARVIAICTKCGKKLDGGFGPGAELSLAKALRRELPAAHGKRRTVRIVETKCLDICPKGAVVVIDSNAPADMLIVPRATPITEFASRIGLAVD